MNQKVSGLEKVPNTKRGVGWLKQSLWSSISLIDSRNKCIHPHVKCILIHVPILRLLRLNQWIKNFLVFFPALGALKLFESDTFGRTVLAFFAFSFLSSAIYIVNDYFDRVSDSKHPVKNKRPLAQGKFSLPNVALIFTIAVVASFFFSYLTEFMGFGILITYLLLQISYSLKIKEIRILEIFFVASGFVLRLAYGGYVSNIHITGWLYSLVASCALMIVVGKRYSEKKYSGDSPFLRKTTRLYPIEYLQVLYALFWSTSVTFYVLWALQPGNVIPSNFALFSAIPFVLALSSYSMNVFKMEAEAPESILLRDKLVLVSCITWLATFLASII